MAGTMAETFHPSAAGWILSGWMQSEWILSGWMQSG